LRGTSFPAGLPEDDAMITRLQSQRRIGAPESALASLGVKAIQHRASVLQHSLQLRDVRVCINAGILIFTFGGVSIFTAIHGEVFLALGAGLEVLGAICVAWWLWFRGRPPQVEVGTQTIDYLQQYREQLEWQRDLLMSIPRWYIGPLAPGLLLLGVVIMMKMPTLWIGGIFLGLLLLILSGYTTYVIWLNRVTARYIEDTLHALPTHLDLDTQ